MTRVPTTRRARKAIAAGGLSVLSLAVAAACSSAPSASSTSSASPSAAGVASSAPAATTSSSAAGVTSTSATTSATTAVSSAAAASAAFKACMVLDTGGVNDHSFNESSWAGMQAAAKANPNIKVSYVNSNSSADYAPNFANEVAAKCDTIVAVGGLMTIPLTAAAKSNPTQKFAEVDSGSTEPNDFSIQFDTAQGGFLGGYLAAAMTKTGKVGTWGGAKIGPVTVYMDGFYDGVQYYDQQKGKSVQVLGWNEKTQNGTFVPGSNGFGDPGAGASITNALIQQGADIIFPVAGGSGIGSATAAEATKGKVSVIWVDTDGCVSAAQYCSVFLSSVVKGLTSSVETYVTDAAAGKIPTTGYVGTLANGGTGIAPFHDFASKVPASVKSELATVTKGIEDGSIKVASPSAPTS
jgi:basic membrane protein A